MNKEITYYYSTENNSFYFFDNSGLKSSLCYNKHSKNWYISYKHESGDKIKTHDIIIYNIPNIINLTSEQYFQYSLIWDYPFPFESAYSIINKAHKNNNRFDVFNIETNYYKPE